MLVVIEGQVFDADDSPIMLVLDAHDKKHIGNMGEQKFYLAFPHKRDAEFGKKIMKFWTPKVAAYEEEKKKRGK